MNSNENNQNQTQDTIVSQVPVVEPTPVLENPVVQEVPVVEPTPVVETPAVQEVPVVESTSAIENPVAPVAPVVESTPTVETPVAPVAPIVESTPAVETPVSPVTPVVEPTLTPTETPNTTPSVEPVSQPANAPVSKKTSPIAIVVLVIALVVLVVFGLNKLGIFSKDEEKTSGGESTNDKTGTKLEDVSINGHMCMGQECSYNINGFDENSSYVYEAENSELFSELNNYDEYIKVNIYYKESKGEKVITGYEIFTKEDNKDISDVKDISQLREKIGLYSLGTQTDELTLKSIGTPGFGMTDSESYTYIDYEFENNAGKTFEMRYKFNNGQSSNDLNLEIDKKYNVTFEVVEGTFDIEYNIKSVN